MGKSRLRAIRNWQVMRHFQGTDESQNDGNAGAVEICFGETGRGLMHAVKVPEVGCLCGGVSKMWKLGDMFSDR